LWLDDNHRRAARTSAAVASNKDVDVTHHVDTDKYARLMAFLLPAWV
jgi:hypothetical protein